MTSEPIRPHPDNPRYFVYEGRPTVLVTAAEHYGAVMNLDFDYVPYLAALKAHGMNLTRLFTGAYLENEEDIGWMKYDNTLAPRSGRLAVPWARSAEDGYRNGGCKFDLDAWDGAYFARLKDFVGRARQSGVIVEVVMFSQMYGENQWSASPLNAQNNVNGVGTDPDGWKVFNTLADEAVAERQEALVRKVVTELNGFPNVYFEICNEPAHNGDQDGVDWHNRLIEAIVDTESSLPAKHMIAVDYDRDYALERVHEAVSVVNTHYTWGDRWVAAMQLLEKHYGIGKALALDETVGVPVHASPADARAEAWQFLMGGGAVYDHLSWAYTPANPTGDIPENVALLKHLGILRGFMEGLDLLHMSPSPEIIRGGVPDGAHARALAGPGRPDGEMSRPGGRCAFYWHHGKITGEMVCRVASGSYRADLVVDLPEGSYRAEWMLPATGEVVATEEFEHASGERTLASPQYTEDVALRIDHA